MKKWHINSSEVDYENAILKINRNKCLHPEKGVSHDFFVIDTYNWINVVAITEEGEFILVKQHRLGSDEFTIETPGGVVDPDESTADCARRELAEETGYRGGEVHLLNSSWSNPAIMSNRIDFYLIDNCIKTGEQNLDDAEDIEIITARGEEVIEMIRNGEISHSIAVTALSLYFLSSKNRFGSVVI